MIKGGRIDSDTLHIDTVVIPINYVERGIFFF